MPFSRLFLQFLLPVFFALRAFGQTHYVDLNCTNPTPPYTNWATAAMNIQDAVDYGGEVVVTNGVYRTGGSPFGVTTNRVFGLTFVTLRSVNGPAVTIIEGSQVPGTTNGPSAIRCVALEGGGNLMGFTLTNGATATINGLEGAGGGLYCSGPTLVSNCVIVGNSAYAGGGGVYGSSATLLRSCTIASNSCVGSGGGLYVGVASNCTFIGNQAKDGGGAYHSPLNNCTLISNLASGSGGGAAVCGLTNCMILGNSADYGGGIYNSGGSAVVNCTVISNLARYGAGGAYLDNRPTCSVPGMNSIFYYNSPDNYLLDGCTRFDSCCTFPGAVGDNVITNVPRFVAPEAGDFRLQSNSPCINAGKNKWISAGTDFGGNPRIVGGTVDIGAYEYQSPTSVLSYGWAQQYGLPTDGSADFADNDGDGMNNWQEWKAGTDPTNAASVLKMFAPSNGAPGLNVSWQSVVGKYYYLLRGTNLLQGLSVIQSNIFAATNVMVYQDTTATNRGRYFYRVGVQ